MYPIPKPQLEGEAGICCVSRFSGSHRSIGMPDAWRLHGILVCPTIESLVKSGIHTDGFSNNPLMALGGIISLSTGQWYSYLYMDVSENSGWKRFSPPIIHFKRENSILNHPFWGKHPYFWKHPTWAMKKKEFFTVCRRHHPTQLFWGGFLQKPMEIRIPSLTNQDDSFGKIEGPWGFFLDQDCTWNLLCTMYYLPFRMPFFKVIFFFVPDFLTLEIQSTSPCSLDGRIKAGRSQMDQAFFSLKKKRRWWMYVYFINRLAMAGKSPLF